MRVVGGGPGSSLVPPEEPSYSIVLLPGHEELQQCMVFLSVGVWNKKFVSFALTPRSWIAAFTEGKILAAVL